MSAYLFLDVDGVLNSMRSSLGLGGPPWPEDIDANQKMDQIAVGLINRLQRNGVKIILSSSWRLEIIEDRASIEEMQRRIGVKFDNITPDLGHGRGFDISSVTSTFNEGDVYVILDDEVEDLLYSQYHHVIQVNEEEGLTFELYTKVCDVLGVMV